ncbi:methyltransferase domain-containing protein [Nocardioides islandensis]|jgi:2-polyprenyl-3-methyl-5-hydroxy-6-metoxy-1,4-benzoquinol methylase|uniref:Methyltransferase domain-containing protein n=2 Tax=Nocardioides islandensis TaxID=433663 RepID=A0A930VAF4_9ACTN|nr:methyltransferase domain-containing protein [Nocardioides islandensis]
MRVGVLVVAYNAASTLAQTLDRLPPSFAASVDHVLVCDDASPDETYDVALRYLERTQLPLTVVKHPENLGYGGNQKAGYHWAIDHGLDVVVLLHGDGQYAPEVIESIVEPLVRGEADAVFGSRMMEKGKARAGGMPMYKYVGNRILSTFQNKVTGLELSEWHSGYRAYRVDALTDIDLDSYTNDFDFDTEIILGLHAAGKKIAEVPIPTYYGDEICHVNGIKYAKDVTKDVIRFKARRMGFGTGPSGLGAMTAHDTEVYELKPSPHSSHGRLLAWTARHRPGTSVLDVGCSDGQFGALVRQQGHRVDGVDLVKHHGVGERLDDFVEADVSQGLPSSTPSYDVIIAGDILEHVVDPETLLKDIRDHLNPGGEILVSVPNFGHWYPRGKVALGRFDYDQRGPLDHTHVRFFTRRTFERLVNTCGLVVVERDVVGSPVDVLDRGGESFVSRAARGAARADRAATAVWPTMFGYQFLYRLEAI